MIPHGTRKAYDFHRCRCEECKAANTATRRMEREQARRNALQRNVPVAQHATRHSTASVLQRPAGWPESVWSRLEEAS